MKEKLAEAIRNRKDGQPEKAITILSELLKETPNDPTINYQMAWTCDSIGKESEAAPYYEKAIANGLTEDRSGAILGLGSTCRCLGEYEKSLRTFDQGIAEFPGDRAMKVFRALTLYNLGRHEGAVSELLVQLLDTTANDSIKSYERALRFYSDKLNEKWT